MTSSTTSRATGALTTAWMALLALVIVGPLLLGRGFGLLSDMVFVPQQPWKPTWLGLDGSVPRAVPSDALTWFATQVLPGDLVQKAVLLAIVALAGLGAAKLAPGTSPLPKLAAGTVYVWNPYVYERLAIGHWALLCGYAALPWVVVAAARLLSKSWWGYAGLVLPMAVAAWTSPTGGVIATGVALAVVLGSGGRRANSKPARTASSVLAIGIALNLPWILPGIAATADQLPADPFGVEAFAARADTPLGVLGSLLSFGGIWKENAVPPGRDNLLIALIALAVTLAGIAGLWLARRKPITGSLTAAGAVGLLLAIAPATAWGAEFFTTIVSEVPGGGMLRDSQKWLAPFVLAISYGTGELAHRLLSGRLVRDRGHQWFWAVSLVILPLALLPALAWGMLGRLEPVRYPDDWEQVRAALEAEQVGDDRVLVLPFGLYRAFDFNDDRAVLDPAPRYFPGIVLTDDALVLEAGTVGGESRTAARIREALAAPSGLTSVIENEQVRFVVVHESINPKRSSTEQLEVPGRVLFSGPNLSLYEVGPAGQGEDRINVAVMVASLLVFGSAGVVITASVAHRVYGILADGSSSYSAEGE